ncbi:MAG: M23 family metallopeptidase [Anaerolineae bacterium]|nr:M23 family metallopeptidase [Anaerolineae bacterium]
MNPRYQHWLWLLVIVGLAACSADAPAIPPTLVSAAPTPVLAATSDEPPAAAAATATTAPAEPAQPAAMADPPTPLPETVLAAAGGGIRPDEVRFSRQATIGPEATLEWRPPPMPVPLSLHPDDHYWLIRPLPSNSRNYDLEWYPYGNDVLLPEIYPYRVHRGLDYPNRPGTPILAASSGTVIHAGPLPSRQNGVLYYGNTVIIKHDWQWRAKDVYTLYAHAMELFVEVGDYVEQGQLIAGVGQTGIVSGPHLHLEVRIGENTSEHTYNPALWVAPYEGWGTLAGRFIDRLGKYIYAAWVGVRPLNVDTPARGQYTYRVPEVNPDDIWQENFVIADLPAGRYEVIVDGGGRRYVHTVDVQPGRTTFLEVAADFVFVPPTPTVPITDTLALPPAEN